MNVASMLMHQARGDLPCENHLEQTCSDAWCGASPFSVLSVCPAINLELIDYADASQYCALLGGRTRAHKYHCMA